MIAAVKTLVEKAKSAAAERDVATQRFIDFRDQHFADGVTLAPEAVQEAREVLDVYRSTKLAAEEKLAAAVSRHDDEQPRLAEAIAEMNKALATVRCLMPRILLVADEEVVHQASVLIDVAVERHSILRDGDTHAFIRAARKELGVRDSRFTTHPNRVRRWYRLRQVRRSVKDVSNE